MQLNTAAAGQQCERSGNGTAPARTPAASSMPVVSGSSTAGRAFKGTAHAVYECLERLDALDRQLVAVFAADHLYRMDVRR